MDTVRETLLALRRTSQPVAVLGAGLVGVALATHLTTWGIKVVLLESLAQQHYYDRSPLLKETQSLISSGVEARFGSNSLSAEECREFGLVIPSPGVPMTRGVLKRFLDTGILMLSEFDLAFGLLGEMPLVLITGSNGKSTTTALIGKLLEASGKRVRVCGNIGTPVISVVAEFIDDDLFQQDAPEVLVVEGSSYQLEQSKYFVPSVAVFLNLAENHLERHGSMEAYFQAKASPFLRQRADHLSVINANDAWGERLAHMVQARVSFFGQEPSTLPLAASISYVPESSQDDITLASGIAFNLSTVPLPGRHNRDNIAAALLAVESLCDDPETIMKGLHAFTGLPHRLEVIHDSYGRIWLNDSKATTVRAAEVGVSATLTAYPTKKLVIMLGGQPKEGSEWGPLIELIKRNSEKISRLVVFGSGAQHLSGVLAEAGLEPLYCAGVAEAVTRTAHELDENTVALFSPGGASFDEFMNFEKRGEYFIEKVKGLERQSV